MCCLRVVYVWRLSSFFSINYINQYWGAKLFEQSVDFKTSITTATYQSLGLIHIGRKLQNHFSNFARGMRDYTTAHLHPWMMISIHWYISWCSNSAHKYEDALSFCHKTVAFKVFLQPSHAIRNLLHSVWNTCGKVKSRYRNMWCHTPVDYVLTTLCLCLLMISMG